MSAAGAALRVMSWAGRWGEALRTAVSGPFSRATGIAVEHHTHVGLQLPELLETALERGAPPPFDLVWSNVVPAMEMARRGLCEPLPPDALPALQRLHPRLAGASTGAPAFAPTYVVHYVLGLRDGTCEPRPSWRLLTQSRLAGRVAFYPGGNGFFAIAQHMGGGRLADIPRDMAACWSFVDAVAASVGALDYSIGMEQHLRSGRLLACFRALPNVLGFRAAGVPVSICTPREGVSETRDVLWIPRGLEPPALTRALGYLQHALSPEVQSHWCALLGALPAHRGAGVPTLFREVPGLPRHVDDLSPVLTVPDEVLATHHRSWADRFDAAVRNRAGTGVHGTRTT
jgi:putative spermidine/putrescine transport system substrate-binding protein